MSWLARIGLALAQPRTALAVAGDREHTGRSGSDLLALIAILLAATQLRYLVSAVWLAGAVDPQLGLRAVVHVLTRTLTLDLGALVIGAVVIFAASGRGREPGRAFDLACVAVVPVVCVELGVQTIVSIGNLPLPDTVAWGIELAAISWMAVLVTIAVSLSRSPATHGDAGVELGRRAGWVVATVALSGFAVQGVWIAQHVDAIRPLVPGGTAPEFSLPRVGSSGQLGERVSRRPGRITVVDFWAMYCQPCLRSMPGLDQFARAHPEIDVLTINMDNPRKARALFDRSHYTLQLLADDGDTSDRFGVVTIPHTVVIDGLGTLREIDGGPNALEAAVQAAQ
jgi:thiol-disulfide isomerase/thioredoxin